MRRVSLLAAPVVALLLVNAGRAADPSWTKDVKPFLTKYCVECHDPAAGKAKGGVDLTSYKALTGNPKKKVLVPGKPDLSLLVRTLTSRGEKKMPPKKSKNQPSDDEIKMIRAWVMAGAKDDSTDAMLPLDRGRDLLASVLGQSTAIRSRRDDVCVE